MEINVVKVCSTIACAIVLLIVWYVSWKVMLVPSLTTDICNCETMLTKTVVIVTGANTGIGFQTAMELARRNAKVILACRDLIKGIRAEEQIRKETENMNVFFHQLDLASFTSIRRFVHNVLTIHKSVHILINNAGTGNLDNSLTEDDLPIEVQVNHYGPFLLTLLLLPKLKKRRHSRIINVSSVMHHFGKVDPENFHKQAKTCFERRRVYSDTKLANMLFTLKLNEVLEGCFVTVNSLHPGAVYTDFYRRQHTIVKFILRVFMKTPWEGAQTIIHLAVARKLRHVSGKYFVNNIECTPSEKALDVNVADRLWLNSERIVEPYLTDKNYY